MISIGIAVSTMIGPTAYAAAAASAAKVSPTDTAGAALAIPMIVSCAGPIASGSSRAGGASAVPAKAVAGRSVISSSPAVIPATASPSAPRKAMPGNVGILIVYEPAARSALRHLRDGRRLAVQPDRHRRGNRHPGRLAGHYRRLAPCLSAIAREGPPGFRLAGS